MDMCFVFLILSGFYFSLSHESISKLISNHQFVSVLWPRKFYHSARRLVDGKNGPEKKKLKRDKDFDMKWGYPDIFFKECVFARYDFNGRRKKNNIPWLKIQFSQLYIIDRIEFKNDQIKKEMSRFQVRLSSDDNVKIDLTWTQLLLDITPSGLKLCGNTGCPIMGTTCESHAIKDCKQEMARTVVLLFFKQQDAAHYFARQIFMSVCEMKIFGVPLKVLPIQLSLSNHNYAKGSKVIFFNKDKSSWLLSKRVTNGIKPDDSYPPKSSIYQNSILIIKRDAVGVIQFLLEDIFYGMDTKFHVIDRVFVWFAKTHNITGKKELYYMNVNIPDEKHMTESVMFSMSERNKGSYFKCSNITQDMIQSSVIGETYAVSKCDSFKGNKVHFSISAIDEIQLLEIAVFNNMFNIFNTNCKINDRCTMFEEGTVCSTDYTKHALEGKCNCKKGYIVLFNTTYGLFRSIINAKPGCLSIYTALGIYFSILIITSVSMLYIRISLDNELERLVLKAKNKRREYIEKEAALRHDSVFSADFIEIGSNISKAIKEKSSNITQDLDFSFNPGII